MLALNQEQARNSAGRKFVISVGSFQLLALIAMLALGLSSGLWQYTSLAAMLGGALLCHIIGSWLWRRTGRQRYVLWLSAGAQLAVVAALPLLFVGSIQLGTLLLVCVFAELVLLGRLHHLPFLLAVTFAFGALMMAADLLAGPDRLIILEQLPYAAKVGLLVAAGIALASVGFLLGLRLRHTRITMALQLALTFAAIAVMAVSVVTGLLTWQTRNVQIQRVGGNFQSLAEINGERIGNSLELQLNALANLVRVPVITEGLREANEAYPADQQQAVQRVRELDEEWRTAPDSSSMVRNVRSSEQALELARFRGLNDFHSNLLLTDRYGGLVASTGVRTDRFFFGNETWWQAAWGNGVGKPFIGQLTINPATGAGSVLIAAGISDPITRELMGVIATNYDISGIQRDVEVLSELTQGRVLLLTNDGYVIAGPPDNELDRQALRWGELVRIGESSTAEWELLPDEMNRPAVVAVAPLDTTSGVNLDPLRSLDWRILVTDTQGNALQEVARSTTLAMLVGLLVIALSVLAAVATARALTHPIEQLTTTAAAIVGGDLERQARPVGSLEFVTLSESFNTLTQRLRQLIGDIQQQLDLTEQREARLAQVNVELAVLNRQLDQARATAEEASSLKSRFLANMSHELRTPLNAIINFTRFMGKARYGELTERQIELQGRVLANAEHLLGLINDILDLSKIEAGKMELILEPTPLRPILEGVAATAVGLTKDKGLELHVELPEELPDLLIDKTRVRQILLNLLSNAAKFTPAGAVTLYAEVREEDVLIAVRDTGSGIPADQIDLVFDEFTQVQGSTSAQGTGLGLPISKRFVELHGGQMWAESVLGVGSTFFFTLLLAGPPAPPADDEPASDGQSASDGQPTSNDQPAGNGQPTNSADTPTSAPASLPG